MLRPVERGGIVHPGMRWWLFEDDDAPEDLDGKEVELSIGTSRTLGGDIDAFLVERKPVRTKPVRILPEYEQVEIPDLREAIFQALGAASTCWEPMDCTGVFESQRAEQIGEELMQVILQWASGRDTQPTAANHQVDEQGFTVHLADECGCAELSGGER